MSQKSLNEKAIADICRKSAKIKVGDSFRAVMLAEEDLLCPLPKGKVVFCGRTDEEALFRSEDGRYYFSLIGGYGCEKGTLYGLEIGLYHDFKHPTDPLSLAEECASQLGSYSTWGGAMAYQFRKRTMKIIRDVVTARR